MGGSHVIITHDALDLTVQPSPEPTPPLDMGAHCTGAPYILLVISGGDHWRHVQTCSL